ncbi:8555_t:CDS:10 [Funneliformis mosseae]|uniref:8555_t:CDS:1 n=1 Tax=Funneliformis mosseae TaxID=27381 RepID=A0A9N9AGZ8_FUNMO|nr:8555_t:CDS:10 [Funneliformis mosseae]
MSTTSTKVHMNILDEERRKWCITGFLGECNVEPFRQKINCYLSSFENIANIEEGVGRRSGKRLGEEHEPAEMINEPSVHIYQPILTNGGISQKKMTKIDSTIDKKFSPMIHSSQHDQVHENLNNQHDNEEHVSIITSRYRSPSNERLEDYNEASPEHEDENPFVVRDVLSNNKFKTVLSWRHVIDNIYINDSSTNDWVAEDHNVSLDFRNFQLDVINQLEGNQTFSYFKDMERILCLSSIMYCSESKPTYVSCSEKLWNKIRPRPLAPIMLPQNLLDDKKLINTKWCENWSLRNTLKTEEDKDVFDCAQIVTRNFFMYLSSVSFNENNELNEDTFVHRYCHQILEEIFGKTDFALVCSKERRILDGNNHGRKPDYRVLGQIDDINRELLFGEIKPPHHSKVISKSVIKLAEFMKGSLDLIINRCGYISGIEIYGILICGDEIKIFNMDLVYDGLYRCSLLSKILLPTENANFLNIVTVNRLRSTISAINSSQPQSSSTCHPYCRKSNSSPKKIRVPIVRA